MLATRIVSSRLLLPSLGAYLKFMKCFEHHTPKIKTLLDVFDHTIKPSLLYASEIWGMFSADKPNKLKDSYFSKLCNDRAVENLHIKFCRPKYSFRCQSQLNNIAVSEFGISVEYHIIFFTFNKN